MLADFAFFYVFFTLCICSFGNCTLPSLPDSTITGTQRRQRVGPYRVPNVLALGDIKRQY